MHSAGARLGSHQLGAYGVAGLGEIAHRRARALADPLSQCEQRRCLRMLRRRVAQQHGLALAGEQGPGDSRSGLGRVARCRRAHALLRRDRGRDVGQRLGPAARGHGDLRGKGNEPLVLHGMQAVDLGASAGRLPQALCEQRVILAQEGADDQGALQAWKARRWRCPASGPRGRHPHCLRHRRIRHGAGDGRCCRCPGHARAWPAGGAPRPCCSRCSTHRSPTARARS